MALSRMQGWGRVLLWGMVILWSGATFVFAEEEAETPTDMSFDMPTGAPTSPADALSESGVVETSPGNITMDFKFRRNRIDKLTREEMLRELEKVANSFDYFEFGWRDFNKLANISANPVKKEFSG